MADPVTDKSELRGIADKIAALPDRIARSMAAVMYPARDPSSAPAPGTASAPTSSAEGSPPPAPESPAPAKPPTPRQLRRNTRSAGIGLLGALGNAGVPLAGRIASAMQTADRVGEAFERWQEARDAEHTDQLERDVAETRAARGLPPVTPPASPPTPKPPRKGPRARKGSRAAGLDVLRSLGSAGLPFAGKAASVIDAVDQWQGARAEERDAGRPDDPPSSPPARTPKPRPPTRPPLAGAVPNPSPPTGPTGREPSTLEQPTPPVPAPPAPETPRPRRRLGDTTFPSTPLRPGLARDPGDTVVGAASADRESAR